MDEPPAADPALPEPLRSLAARVGDTPLLPLPSPPGGARVAGKAEWMNPGGSVKDRPALAMVREALAAGELDGRRLLDASSGNTAIAYAMLGAAGGFGVTLCVPGSASDERTRTLRAYGAELVVTDPLEGSDGAVREARRLADRRPGDFWYADQYSNPANPRAHRRTTAPEIWAQTDGEVTHVVVGLGTTGTAMGVARFFGERAPEVRVVGVEPAGGLHGIEGLKHLETAETPAIFDPSLLDGRRRVETERAQEGARRLAREAGVFAGVSSGAAWSAARDVARAAGDGTVVALLPDGGGRYLSEAWWDG
jgi:cysteine synthase B